MADSLQIGRVSKSKLPRLAEGELVWVKDERILYIGTGNGNTPVTVVLSNGLAQLEGALNNMAATIPPMAYPVGAVYTSTSNTDPATLFGGTWVSVTPLSPYITDDTTGDKYRVGVDDGLVYVEDAADAPTYYSWKRTN